MLFVSADKGDLSRFGGSFGSWLSKRTGEFNKLKTEKDIIDFVEKAFADPSLSIGDGYKEKVRNAMKDKAKYGAKGMLQYLYNIYMNSAGLGVISNKEEVIEKIAEELKKKSSTVTKEEYWEKLYDALTASEGFDKDWNTPPSVKVLIEKLTKYIEGYGTPHPGSV